MVFVGAVLFAVGLAVLVARRFGAPLPFVLVATGVALGVVGVKWPILAPTFGLSHEVMFGVLLPPLLFESAYALPGEELRRHWKLSFLLAGPGVIVAAGLATVGAWLLLRALGEEVPLGTLALLGAVLSATDPVAVVAILRRSRAPLSVRAVLDAESLLNDGTAVVLLRATVAGITGRIAWLEVLRRATWEVGAGVLFGWGLAWIAAKVAARVRGSAVALSLVLAYGAFHAAEAAQASGLFAALVAGFVFARDGGRSRAFDEAWGAIVFAANAVLFLLVGITLDVRGARHEALAVGAVWLALLGARAVLVEGAGAAVRRKGAAGFAPWTRAALVAGGLRGGLSLALALDLGDARVVALTSGVVLLTLVFQGGFFFVVRPRWVRIPPAGS
ncbi:MAG TPA: cation:proton antiporter [Polyangiaceae bacterium]